MTEKFMPTAYLNFINKLKRVLVVSEKSYNISIFCDDPFQLIHLHKALQFIILRDEEHYFHLALLLSSASKKCVKKGH